MVKGVEKSRLSIRATLLLIISVLNILIAVLVGSGVYNSWVKLQEVHSLKETTITISLLYKTMKYLSLERGASMSALYAPPATSQELYANIIANRKQFDLDLNEALSRLKRGASQDLSSKIAPIKEKLQILQALRQELDAVIKEPEKEKNQSLPDRIFEASLSLVSEIQSLIIFCALPQQKIDAIAFQHMRFRYLVWELTEYAGREYALIGRLIVENKPLTPELQERLLMWRGRIQHDWELIHQLSTGSDLEGILAPYIDEAETHYFMTFDQIKDFFYTPGIFSSDKPYPITIEIWLVLASEAVESLLTLKDMALQETQEYVVLMEVEAKQAILINVFLFVCALLLSLYCLKVIMERVIRPVNLIVDTLYKATRGETYDPLPVVNYGDEVGKLVEVLEVFQKNTRKIEQSNIELERFAYISAHDLKSPLRAINALSKWIEEELGANLHGKAKEHMELLRARVRRMEKLLDDTLEYSRAGTKFAQGPSEMVNGMTLIDDIIVLTSPPKGFKIKASENFSKVSLPRMPLQQVFYNLVNNAIKHHDRADGVIELSIQEDADDYIICVRDDGPGIEPQYHQKIFEMFQTLKSRDEKEGSGMGLALVKKILHACGSEIIVESELGKGALFRFRWPKYQEELKHAQ